MNKNKHLPKTLHPFYKRRIRGIILTCFIAFSIGYFFIQYQYAFAGTPKDQSISDEFEDKVGMSSSIYINNSGTSITAVANYNPNSITSSYLGSAPVAIYPETTPVLISVNQGDKIKIDVYLTIKSNNSYTGIFGRGRISASRSLQQKFNIPAGELEADKVFLRMGFYSPHKKRRIS